MQALAISREFGIKLVRYGFIGASSVAVYLVLYEVLRRFAGFGVLTSVVGAYVPTLVLTFLAQSRLTFAFKELSTKIVVKYLISVAFSLGIVIGTVWLANGVLGLPELVANLLACITSPLLGFVLQNNWVFRSQLPPADPEPPRNFKSSPEHDVNDRKTYK